MGLLLGMQTNNFLQVLQTFLRAANGKTGQILTPSYCLPSSGSFCGAHKFKLVDLLVVSDLGVA